MNHDTQEWVSITEATQILGLSRTTVRKRIADGMIRGARVNPLDTRYVLIPRSEIERMLAEGRHFRS